MARFTIEDEFDNAGKIHSEGYRFGEVSKRLMVVMTLAHNYRAKQTEGAEDFGCSANGYVSCFHSEVFAI